MPRVGVPKNLFIGPLTEKKMLRTVALCLSPQECVHSPHPHTKNVC